MREAAFQMIRWSKEQGCRVMVNSSDSSDHFQDYLTQGADFVILGEGEITLRELIFHLESGETDFSQIQGIAYQVQNAEGALSAIKTLPRPVLQDLDSLPIPAWDLIDVESYRKIWARKKRPFTLNLATTRGCPFKCNWCAKPIYGNRYNSRSPVKVVAEIEYLIHQFGVRHFWMADDIFGLKPGWVQEFQRLVASKKLDFSYKIQSRVDLLLKEDTIDALAASGLRQVWVGAESGSQKILDAMDKGTQVEEIYEATKLLKSKGIEVCLFLQFGYLGENKEDIERTLKMLDDLEPHDIGISVCYPLPGTKFYDKVKDLLGQKHNWTVSDDLDLMYPGTYSPAFYKRLHRLAHKRFRLRQGFGEWLKFWQKGNVNWAKAFKTLYYAPAVFFDVWRLRRLEP
jgi:anaerobic magnesium-protoporphyrin IX monomethyl ester cyclase